MSNQLNQDDSNKQDEEQLHKEEESIELADGTTLPKISHTSANEEHGSKQLLEQDKKIVQSQPSKARKLPEVTLENTEEDDEDADYKCGCSFFKPDWLQRFRTPIMFLINYGIVGFLRVTYFHHTISSLSTIEKRYAFPSKYSSIILIADNISSMIINPLVGYLGTRVNRPRLVGSGILLCAFSSLLSALPYFIYGPATHLLNQDDFTINPGNSIFSSKHSAFNNTNSSFTLDYCGTETPECKGSQHSFAFGAFLILVIASFLNGIGYSSFWTVGIPYLDDNVKKSNSPIYISITTVIRMFGVTVGYFISSYSLSLYEDPSLSPNIKTNDPRWVGAWWLGFFVIGILMAITTLPFFLFPPSMKKGAKKLEPEKALSTSDAFRVLKKLMRNPILVLDTMGGAIRFIGFAGYWINKPRYIEAQFNQSAAKSSFLTGSTSIVMKCVGILLGGIFMSKYRPKPRLLVSLIIVVEVICNVLMFSAMFIGCPSPKFGHISSEDHKMYDLDCNANCNCSQAVFQPVCGPDGQTNFFSPCYAGCESDFSYRSEDGKTAFFTKCACQNGTFTSGYCKPPPEEECNQLIYYLFILSMVSIVSSFARTPNIMIAMRSVDKEHKSFAFGVVESFFSIFCYIPYPIIFSFVCDAACIVWERSCGKEGNCWLYDLEKFRYLLHGVAVCFLVLGTFFDLGIWYYADRLKGLYDDEEEPEDINMRKLSFQGTFPPLAMDDKIAEEALQRRLSIISSQKEEK